MALKYRRIIILLLILFLTTPQIPCYACGPLSPEAVFAYPNHPDLPLKKFAQGNFGILQPSLAMSYLVVAYRYLTNNPLNTAEQKAVVALWHQRLAEWGQYGEQIVKPWLTIRNTVPGIKKLSVNDLSIYKYSEAAYEEYTYCTPSTFTTAINTLKARIAKYGISSPQVKFWLTNQDRVFQNCSTDKAKNITIVPKPPAANADNLSKADYAYQTAAANFYAENFDLARNQFEQIAKNPQSPWQKLSGYMAARTLFLKNTDIFGKRGNETADAQAITLTIKEQEQTAQYLYGLLNDPSLVEYRDDIQTLLNILEFRLHPMLRYHQLVQAILQPNAGNTIENDLGDYTIMLDSFLTSPDAPDNSVTPPEVKQKHDEAIKDDLTDWLFSFADNTEIGAVKKWQTTRSLPWLIVALCHTTENNPALPQLLSAAQSIPANSPAYLSVQYYSVLALIKSHKDQEARQKLDQLLSLNLPLMTPSARNMFLVQRLKLAQSLTESIKYALKQPVASVFGYSYKMLPDDFDKIEQGNNYATPLQGTFDNQMAQAINQYFPFSLWTSLALNKTLPSKLHNQVVGCAWTRAILLNDGKVANTLTPLLQSAYPVFKSWLAEYRSAQNPIEKRFSACYIFLKGLGLSPYLRGNLGRSESNILERDEYGDNFWIPPDPDEKSKDLNPSSDTYGDSAISRVDLAKFITGSEKQAAFREAKILYTTASPAYFITEAVLAMAKYKPNDPRIPEALFRAVKMPRWGCHVPEASQYSKAAFQLLHSKYANSSWAKRAQYYY